MLQLSPTSLFAIEAPEGAKDFRFKYSATDKLWVLVYDTPDSKIPVEWNICEYPDYFHFKGDEEIIGLSNELSEVQTSEVVEPVNNPFIKNYLGNRIYPDFTKPQSDTVADAKCNAKESLQSLLEANNLNPSKYYLIIRKVDK
jgi:hypothetical protein